MRLEFEITEREYGKAVRKVNKNLGDWYRPLRIGGITCAAIGMAMLFGADRSNWIASTLLVLFGLFVPIYPMLVTSRRENEGWRQYSVLGAVAWDFNDDGLSFQSELTNSHWQWRAFDRFLETRNLFLLYHGSGMPLLISKRAFADIDQEKAFRSFITEKLSPPTGGFPVKLIP